MRYLCTIYNRDFTSGGIESVLVGTTNVTGATLREAAARAYVLCVGRQRARVMRDEHKAPRTVIAQETNVRAIALSLRKKPARLGACYQLDNMVEAWDIHVEPLPSTAPRPAIPSTHLRRIRLPHLVLLRHLSSPSSN